MGPRILALLTALFVALLAPASSAQIVCKPGQGCRIEVQPPPVQWQPPSGHMGGQTQVPSTHGGGHWQIELARRARWEAYFQWRAQVTAEIRASIDARFYIEQMKVQVRRTADPYASMPAPSYGIPSDARVRFPRIDLGLFAFCFGGYSGPGEPTYLGYCPAFRLRINRRIGVALDPAVVASYYDNLSFGMFGLRPGVQFSFIQGKRSISASHVYAVTGLDLWLPFGTDDKAPAVFLGGHAGLGAMISQGRLGIGFEVRGLVRGGLGDQEDPVAREMSSFRVGFEGRAPVIYLSFP